MQVEITKYKNGGYTYSVQLFDESSPLWIFESNKTETNPKLPNGQWHKIHYTVWQFLNCQYKPYKNRWFVQSKKEDFGRVWTFRLLA